MNAQPALPARLGVVSGALACLLAGACSGKAVSLDRPQAEASNEAPPVTEDGLVLRSDGYPFIHDLVVDETHLYWVKTNDELQGCPKRDCQDSIVTYAAHADINPNTGFAVSEGNVFWLGNPDGDAIYVCPSSGCRGEPTRLIRDPALQAGLTADDGRVYWLSAGGLYRCPAAGCSSVGELATFGEGKLPQFYQGDAYWVGQVSSPSPERLYVDQIRRAPQDGSTPSTIVEQREPIDWLALGGGYAYWLKENQILRCPLSGCESPELFEPNSTVKVRLQADETGIYWLEEIPDDYLYHDAVHYCSHEGCRENTAFATIDELVNYALDDEFVYLVNHVRTSGKWQGGFIHRVTKPSR